MILRSCILASAVLLGGIGFVALSPTAQSRNTADSFTIDPVHSTVIFRVKHLNTSYSFGRFNDISGTVTWDDANPSSGGFDLIRRGNSAYLVIAKANQLALRVLPLDGVASSWWTPSFGQVQVSALCNVSNPELAAGDESLVLAWSQSCGTNPTTVGVATFK